MNVLKELDHIRQIYQQGGNVISFLNKNRSRNGNTLESIMISYDFQAGRYISFAQKNPEFVNKFCGALADVIKGLGDFSSILEVGIGDATTFGNLMRRLRGRYDQGYGFDISWSRIKKARSFLRTLGVARTTLFTGDLFESPLRDNSVDIVYTSNSIEPNGGREKEALRELYRITNKYLILLEPAYELASKRAQARMRSHGYVRNLYATAKKLKFKVLDWRLFGFSANPLNPTGILLIEKDAHAKPADADPLACPVTKTPLKKIRGAYFSEKSLLVYPIIDSIPCLLSQNAVIATHYLDG